MAIDRLLRANRKVMLLPLVDIDGVLYVVGADGSLAPFTAPTLAVLNSWVPVTSPGYSAASENGGNISCALLDDLTLGTGESDTDDELTICSLGNESTPTFKNLEATLTALRDADKTDATSEFNLATQLLNGADVRYAVFDAVGRRSNALLQLGDKIHLYGIRTDNPVDVKEDRGNTKIQQAPTATGDILQNYTLAA